jgi:hypothetical protein
MHHLMLLCFIFAGKLLAHDHCLEVLAVIA